MDGLLSQKLCGRCGRMLSRSEFNRDRNTKSGLRSQCRDCMADERARTTEQRRAWRQRPEVKERYRVYRKARYWQDKVKSDARNAARVLIRQPCEVCASPKAQAHHDDYGKPLDVRWLCTTHHAEWHKHNTPKCPNQEIAA